MTSGAESSPRTTTDRDGLTRLLYVAYWGLCEPLGQSLILPAVRAMAQRGIRVELLTFDKRQDLSNEEDVRNLQAELRDLGVDWSALRYHKRPSLLAKIYDIALGCLVGLRGIVRHRPELILGRTPLGGLMVGILALVTRKPWIYHIEGLWPDQQVEGGFWAHGSALHRASLAVERWLYRSAAGLIVLSRRSLPAFAAILGNQASKPIAVVPSCTDTEHFITGPPRAEGSALNLVYIGSLGGRYSVEHVAQFFASVRRLDRSVRLSVLTHSDRAGIRPAFERLGIPSEAWALDFVHHREMPTRLQSADAGLMFVKGGAGAESSSPTKVGEYWACGLPVVSLAGIGDVDVIVEERRVGVLVRDESTRAMDDAAGELLALLQDPGLRIRCRQAALDYYSLAHGVESQLDLFRQVLDRSSGKRR